MGIAPRLAFGLIVSVCAAAGPYLEVLRQDNVLMPSRQYPSHIVLPILHTQ